MTTISDTILIACLDALEEGEAVAEILRRYPEHAEELRPFLNTAVLLQELPPAPPEIAAELSKKAFLQEAERMKTAVSPKPVRRSWVQMLRPVLALALVILALGVTLLSAANAALPGDMLYTTKRFVEDVRLSRTTNPAAHEKLVASFKQERLREVNTLLQAGRSAVVTFSGQVEAIADTQWMISGVLVKVTPDTAITGTIVEGAEAEVNGRVTGGMLTAIMITLPETGESEPESTTTPIPPTATAVSPTATPTPIPATATSSPTPEVEKGLPKPTPTVAVHENANGNEAGDDGNENEPAADDSAGEDNNNDAGDGQDNSGSGNNNDDDGSGSSSGDSGNDGGDSSGSGGDSDSGSGGGEENSNDNDHSEGGNENSNENGGDHSDSGGGDDDSSNDNSDDDSSHESEEENGNG